MFMNRYVETYKKSLEKGELNTFKNTNISKCSNLIFLIISNLDNPVKVSEVYETAQDFMNDLIEIERFFNQYYVIFKYKFLLEDKLDFKVSAMSGNECHLSEIRNLARLFDKGSVPENTIYHLKELCKPFLEYESQTTKLWKKFLK